MKERLPLAFESKILLACNLFFLSFKSKYFFETENLKEEKSLLTKELEDLKLHNEILEQKKILMSERNILFQIMFSLVSR